MEIKTIKKEEIEKVIDLKNISVYNLCNGVIGNVNYICPHINIRKENGKTILEAIDGKNVEYFEDINGNSLVCCKEYSPEHIKFWYKDEDEE